MTAKEFQEIKSLITSLKDADDSLPDEIKLLQKKKLKQETNKARWIVPLIASITPLCAVIVTLLITFNTNLLDDKSILNQVTERRNEIAKTETNLLQENKEKKILIETYSLLKIRDTLGVQVQSMRIKADNLKSLNSTLTHNFEETRNFAQIDHDLFTVKWHPERDNGSVDNLINALKNNSKYSKRIADSLNSYVSLSTPYLGGLCAYILYFGTGNDAYREGIIDHLRNRFDSSRKSSVNYSEILTSYRWNSSDRVLFTKTLMDLLNPNRALRDNVFILQQIGSFQNYFDDFNLERIDFNLFLKYLHYCKMCLRNDYDDRNTNKVIVVSIAKVCPQIFISERFILLNASINAISNKSIDTAKAASINASMIYTVQFLEEEDAFQPKITNLYSKLYESINADEASKEAFYIKNKAIFDFWDNVLFETGPLNVEILRRKVVNREM
jgi:hypothetical protein